MRNVLIAAPAAEEFESFERGERRHILKMMRGLRDSPERLKPLRVRSELLDTTIYMVRSGSYQMVYEIDAGRTIVLALRHDPAKTRVKSPVARPARAK